MHWFSQRKLKNDANIDFQAVIMDQMIPNLKVTWIHLWIKRYLQGIYSWSIKLLKVYNQQMIKTSD